jgi:Cu/Ag efflux pump CusA
MTVPLILARLLPIMWSRVTEAQVMQRIAVPMAGAMVTARLPSMSVMPLLLFLRSPFGG